MSTLLWLLLQLAAASAASVTIKEGIAGQTCFVQPIPFASKSFSYTVSIDPALTQLPAGCDASQILLSPLFTSGSCLNPSDNSKSGCPTSDGIVISGTSSSAGTRVPLNSSTPLCNQAFGSGETYSILDGAATYDRGTVICGPSSTGYLYFQNNCPAGGNQSVFQIKVDYTVNYPSCSGSGGLYYDDYYSNTWSDWPMILGICIAVFIVVFILLAICGKRRRQQQLNTQMQMPPPGGIQMMPPPPPGQGGMAYGVPYQGGPPAGYPPPQPMSSANFIPPPSGTSAYPSHPTMPSSTIGGGGGNVGTSSSTSQYPTPEGVAQPAIWYAGGRPPS